MRGMWSMLDMALSPHRIYFFVFILIISFGTSFYFYATTTHTFEKDVYSCNRAKPHLRFSCYRVTLENHFPQADDTGQYVRTLEKNTELSLKTVDNQAYAIFGTNCHTFYHAVGDFAATHAGDKPLQELLSYNSGKCTAGYTMGVYKRLALADGYSTALLKSFYDVCPQGQENQCSHEIGHLLHDKHTYSVLKIIDSVSERDYGLTYPKTYRYAVSSSTDLNAPFEECEEIIPISKPDLIRQCYTGVGHNLFLFSEFSPDGFASQFRECSTISEENRENCFAFLLYRIGINEGAPRFLDTNFAAGNSICTDVIRQIEALGVSNTSDLRTHCYIGIGGGIGLFIDSEYSSGEYTSSVTDIERLTGYAKLCEEAPLEFVDNCLAGLMGTKFKKLYADFKLKYEPIEKLLPKLNTTFEVTG